MSQVINFLLKPKVTYRILYSYDQLSGQTANVSNVGRLGKSNQDDSG
jgi:hypothetical protein